MGLMAMVSPDDCNLPPIGEIDYSAGSAAFVSTFMSVATAACPVDTGYLVGSISAEDNGYGCTAQATAEYAEYVEYGTWKMAAQPYFEDAVAAGLEAAGPYWLEAVLDFYGAIKEKLEEQIEWAQDWVDNLNATETGGPLADYIEETVLGPLLEQLADLLETIAEIIANYAIDAAISIFFM